MNKYLIGFGLLFILLIVLLICYFNNDRFSDYKKLDCKILNNAYIINWKDGTI